MSLKEIFCQDKAVNILQRAFASGKSAHAYIFAGTQGIGKFKTAREHAKLLLCESPVREKSGFADSCGSCESCRLFEGDSHPDFHHIYKELREFTENGKGKAAPVDLPIDVIRQFLISKVSGRPIQSQRKIFIVSEAEKLNVSSQNCLLKVLEEPPAYCSIILLCTRMEKLLATTKSRCQTITFGPIEQEKIIEQLKQMEIPKIQAQYFARLADGSLGIGCQWAKLELAEANLYDTKKELIESLSELDFADCLDSAQWLLEQSKTIAGIWSKLEPDTSKIDLNRRAQKTLIQIIISAFYDAMRLSITPAGSIINFEQKEQIKKLSARFGPEILAEKITQGYKTINWVDSNVNEKLIFEQLLLNLVPSDTMRV